MNVDRNGTPLAVGLGKLLQWSRYDLVPAALVRKRRNVGERALFGILERVVAEDLRRRGRIARRDIGLQRRHRRAAATTGNRHVLPDKSLLGNGLLDDVERGRLAT